LVLSLELRYVSTAEGRSSFDEVTLLRVAPGGAGLSLVARLTHRGEGTARARITRAVAMGGRYLWTVVPGGVEVRDLDTLRVTSRAAL